MAALRRHPILEGKVVKKVAHNPVLPNSPTVPKISSVDLIHLHFCWMIQQLDPNYPQTPITIRGEKRYPFLSQALLAPPVEMSVSLCLV